MADNNIAHAMALVTTRGLWALPGNLCSSRQFYAWCENIGCRFLGGPIALHCPTRAGWRQEFRGVVSDTAWKLPKHKVIKAWLQHILLNDENSWA